VENNAPIPFLLLLSSVGVGCGRVFVCGRVGAWTLHQNPNHIINRLLVENGVALGNCFPLTMTRESIPLNDIESAFTLHNIMNYKSGIVSQMLNAFFKMKVYEPDKRRQTIGKYST
jgi:hypothetical protein